MNRKAKEIKPDFPDTANGAIDYLKKNATIEMKGAKAFADPQVDGVWKVTHPHDEKYEYSIVYLKGYREPLGNIRRENDFESIYRD